MFLGLWFVAFSAPLAAVMVCAADRIVGLVRRRPGLTRAIDYGFAALFGAFAVRILTTQSR